MSAAIWFLLLSAPLASGFQQFVGKGEEQLDLEHLVVNDEISAVSGSAPEGAAAPGELVGGGVATLLELGTGPSLASVGHQGGESGHQGGESSTAAMSNRHLFRSRGDAPRDPALEKVLAKTAKLIEADKRGFFAHLTQEERAKLAKQVADQNDTSFVDVVAPPPVMGRPSLLPPSRELMSSGPAFVPPRRQVSERPSLVAGLRRPEEAGAVSKPGQGGPVSESLLESSGSSGGGGSASEAGTWESDFQPSSEFMSSAGQLAEASADLPWGVGSPRAGDSLPVFHYSSMPAIDFPKEWEYSLNSGDNIQSFSNAQQDVKLLTQIFPNITQGFFLDTNAGNGEEPSNTLLLELLGWRGLIMEPRGYKYLELWGKMRKAWLFLGCISPHENATRIGFDTEGNIDMLSGHMIHAYNMKDFMAEMGGRKTIDFWNLHSGGYEAEILNETLLGVGSFLEFGVILVRFDGRRTGRGYESFVQPRSKDETEEIIFEILHNASFKYIGGLDAYWINHVSPRFDFKDKVFVNPSYFTARNLPVPTTIKSAPPPPLSYPGDVPGHQFYTGARKSASAEFPALADWDSGFDASEVSKIVVAFVKASREDAAANQEPPAKAVRVPSTKLADYYDSVGTDA